MCTVEVQQDAGASCGLWHWPAPTHVPYQEE